MPVGVLPVPRGTTIKVAVTDLVTPPPVAVMVSVEVPVGVLVDVLTKSVELPVGVTLSGVKVAVAPLGRPEKLRETVWGGPVTSVTVTSYEVDWPWSTVWLSGEAETVKSNVTSQPFSCMNG